MRSAAQLSVAYGREIARGIVRYRIDPHDVARSLPPWWRSTRDPGRTPLGDRIPWVTYAALRRLRAHVVGGTRVFEYGVGGSSAFFLDRGARLVSVDHDEQWSARVRRACGTGWDSHTVPPTHPEEAGYESAVLDGSLRDYASVIDDYGEFDLVLVDGRARSACLRHAQHHVAPGGLLVLDNSERPRYAAAAAHVDLLGWDRVDLFGPGPYNPFFWRTTIWARGA